MPCPGLNAGAGHLKQSGDLQVALALADNLPDLAHSGLDTGHIELIEFSDLI